MADKKISDFTAATALASGDLLEIEQVSGGDSRKITADNASKSLRVLGFRGVKVKMTSDDTAQNITTQTAITFDATVFDTDSFWAGGAPTRITIPSVTPAINYVELFGQMIGSSSTADTGALLKILHRNSSNTLLETFGNYGFNEQSGTQRGQQVVTGPVAVAAGDYFTLEAREETDNSITIEGDGTASEAINTFMSLKVIG